LLRFKIAGASCAADGDLSMNSKCYRKFYNSSSFSWYSASNDCLSRGGSLAVFTDIRRPSDSSNLTTWLNNVNVYWIGLIRSWWIITSEGEFELLRKQCAGYVAVFQSMIAVLVQYLSALRLKNHIKGKAQNGQEILTPCAQRQ